MFYEPRNGHGMPHDPFKALVSPRPIGWISTQASNGALNLAPYSFFNAISTNPHLVLFSSEGMKDSATFAKETKEFVANIVGRDLAERMNKTAVDAPRGISEFDYAGLTAAPSRTITPPRVAEAPAALECKVTKIFEPDGLDGKSAGVVVVIGEVTGVHINDEFIGPDGLYDAVKAGNLSRLGYMDYASVDKVFAMRRPRWEID
ncbi:flavin reductase family protein [Mesorhizobium sp. NBSH29]|uniref:flavin reductase family protein n=1 Tax=Mesorhizobium sp. NBSH29 TaxID=2654249 RepID=UPI00189670CD|nr:flavin reductase family protein [Mesorhizobium sp. NBSH29]QPC87597.1 flavin reductase family protein [Mesorhizobium sp. NBSH29]